MDDKEIKLVNRIYPAIKSCVGNRYKIVTGIFSVYAFIVSSLNQHREVINQSVALFTAWIFTFFVIHNSLNYSFNAWEQYSLEETYQNKSNCEKCRYLFRVEWLYSLLMMAIIWAGYFYIIKPIFSQT